MSDRRVSWAKDVPDNSRSSSSQRKQGDGKVMPAMIQYISQETANESARIHAQEVAAQNKDNRPKIAEQAAARQFDEHDDDMFYPNRR